VRELQLDDLVRINDMLTWSPDYRHSFVRACNLIGELVGASMAPAYIIDESGTLLVLVTDEPTAARLGEEYRTMPVVPHVRPPWVNPGEWPVQAKEILGTEAWQILPGSFTAWFGETGIVASIHADGRHLGAVLLCFDGDYTLNAVTRSWLRAACRILGSAIYRWQAAAREREIGALQERRRLAEELHDDISQQVASLGYRVDGALLAEGKGDTALVAQDLRDLNEGVMGLKRSLRHQMLGLRAESLTGGGSFLASIREQLDHFRGQFDLPVEFICPWGDAADRIPLDIATQLLRVLQEGLANAYRHSHATHVAIRLFGTSTKVRLEIEDDGTGFDPSGVPESRMGVRIMRQRLEQIDGSLELGPASPRGTILVAEAPVHYLSASPLRIEGKA
jgi:signal transduction histidine kinase